MTKVSRITGATVVAFQEGHHCLLEGGELVWKGDRIIHVGRDFPETVDEEINGQGTLVLPGLINLHVHGGIDRQVFMLDLGRRDLLGSGLLCYLTPLHQKPPLDEKDCRTGAQFALYQLVKNGSTTFMHLGADPKECDIMAEEAEKLGVRAYIAPPVRSAYEQLDHEGRLHYRWNEKRGEQDLRTAVDFAQSLRGIAHDRIQPFLYAYTVDTCTPQLLKESKVEARRLGVPFHIHAAYTLYEFHEILRRYGKTPIVYLDDLGILDKGTILGHCIFTSGHRQVPYPNGDDLSILARSGVTVAHCPLVFARRGIALDTMARYLRQGINLGLGTDSVPFDIIGEMRIASLICKVMEQDFSVGRADEILNLVTLGGSKALGRDDLGRIEPGAKADMTILRLESLYLLPFYDPIRALLAGGSGHLVETVIIDGKKVVTDGRVTKLDEGSLFHDVQEIGMKNLSFLVAHHWSAMKKAEIFPPSLPYYKL